MTTRPEMIDPEVALEYPILHAAPMSPGVPMTPEGVQAEVLDWAQTATRLAAVVGARVAALTGRPETEIQVIVEQGPAAKAIVHGAEDVGADLIVVGAFGETGMGRSLLGSVAEVVVRDASCSA